MAKITVEGGPSFSDHEQSDPDFEAVAPPAFLIRRAQLGEVDRPSHSRPEVGGPSSTSSENDVTSNDTGNQFPRPPAQTTESPSSLPPAVENSTVPSTDGDGHETEQPPSDEESKLAKKTTTPRKTAAKKATPPAAAAENPKAARVRLVDEDEF